MPAVSEDTMHLAQQGKITVSEDIARRSLEVCRVRFAELRNGPRLSSVSETLDRINEMTFLRESMWIARSILLEATDANPFN